MTMSIMRQRHRSRQRRRVRLLFVDNDPKTFVLHRFNLALGLRDMGFEIHVASPAGDAVGIIEAAGFHHHAIPLDRKSTNPLSEVGTLAALIRLCRRVRPDIVHNLRLKPVLYGGIAANLTRVPACVGTLTGLGHVFTTKTRKTAFIQPLVLLALRVVFAARSRRLIVENGDDRDLLITARVLEPERISVMSSGVDIRRFRPEPEPAGPLVVLCAARLLREKGIPAFLETARRIRASGVSARFILAGSPDPGNPSTLRGKDLQSSIDRGDIEWQQWNDNMPRLIASSHIACLPSHREGVPRFLLEAAACGKPIVTTDAPGCREVVRDGENGFIVPIDDVDALVRALCRLILEPEVRSRFALMSRRIAEDVFSAEAALEHALSIYRAFLGSSSRPPLSRWAAPEPAYYRERI